MRTIRVYPDSEYFKNESGDILYGYPNPKVYDDPIMSKLDYGNDFFISFDNDCWIGEIAIDKSTGICSSGRFCCDINELNSFLSEA